MRRSNRTVVVTLLRELLLPLLKCGCESLDLRWLRCREVVAFAQVAAEVIEPRRAAVLDDDFPGALANCLHVAGFPEQCSIRNSFVLQQQRLEAQAVQGVRPLRIRL